MQQSNVARWVGISSCAKIKEDFFLQLYIPILGPAGNKEAVKPSLLVLAFFLCFWELMILWVWNGIMLSSCVTRTGGAWLEVSHPPVVLSQVPSSGSALNVLLSIVSFSFISGLSTVSLNTMTNGCSFSPPPVPSPAPFLGDSQLWGCQHSPVSPSNPFSIS